MSAFVVYAGTSDERLPEFVHRVFGRADSITIEGVPMVYKNRSIASKVRRKANSRGCDGKALEEKYDPRIHHYAVLDGSFENNPINNAERRECACFKLLYFLLRRN